MITFFLMPRVNKRLVHDDCRGHKILRHILEVNLYLFLFITHFLAIEYFGEVQQFTYLFVIYILCLIPILRFVLIHSEKKI